MGLQIKITRVKCITMQDFSGSDDIYLKFRRPVLRAVGMGSVPTSRLNLGSYHDGISRSFSSVEFILGMSNSPMEFFEDDTISGDDLVGTISLTGLSPGNGQIFRISGSGATYEVTLNVTNSPGTLLDDTMA
ncbi:MAG: hypothetical protein MUC97_09090 [Bernardetiaceae bacterium]|jgi:hypothetical protein|nr:hypothetical protein [Bernardetiaceae bacterium]